MALVLLVYMMDEEGKKERYSGGVKSFIFDTFEEVRANAGTVKDCLGLRVIFENI